MDALSIAQRAQAWLRSTWNIEVPFSWLEACVDWILGESRSTTFSQVQINKHVLEQWLLTDLRDLSHPVLPDHASEAVKIELSGSYCLQMDSVVDISQPAYSQLQQWRGKDVSNDTVSAVTQATQRPWESKATRVLLLQLTDGVQSLQGMEYQPIPSLNVNLQPGTKILLRGTVTCRLGVLLLKPENVKVIGGEVEDLVEQNSQGRVLCSLLGLPEDIPQENGVQRVEPLQHEDALTDEELLAGLEVDDQLISMELSTESGYVTRNRVFSGMGGDAVQNSNSQHRGLSASSLLLESQTDCLDVELVDEDFDIPFEEQDEDPFSRPNVPPGVQQASVNGGPIPILNSCSVQTQSLSVCANAETDGPGLRQVGVSVPELQISTSYLISESVCTGSKVEPQQFVKARAGALAGPTAAMGLDSPPFTYLSVLQADKTTGVKVVRVKAFIITLLGSLLSCSGKWQVRVTISDGTAYLDADLSDGVLVGLIGFSVTESKAAKKDPEQRKRLAVGLQNCQRELVDMCCIMTVEYDSVAVKAVVLAAKQVSGEDCRDLENRVICRRR